MKTLEAFSAFACFVSTTFGCGPSDVGRPAPRAGSIGAVLAQRHTDGRVLVREVPEGLAAAQAGLREADEILLIDGRDVRRMSPAEIHLALEGQVGSTVRLTIWRHGEVERLTLTRAPLQARP